MRKIITISAIVLILSFGDLISRPQYSVMQMFGTKCQNCHIKGASGGMRNFSGWGSRSGSSIVNPASIGLQGLYDLVQNSNSLANDMITVGMDFRYQTARWGGPENSERDWMLMQWVPYVNVNPISWLNIEGWYNIAYDIETEKRYPGQESYSYSATIKPIDYLPSLKVGYFAPVIGTKYEDHTLLVRTVVSGQGARPMIPWDYAELGFELKYDNISWLELSFGMWESKNAKIMGTVNNQGQRIPVVNGNNMTSVLNAQWHPQAPWGLNMFAGATYLLNGSLKTDDGIYIGKDYFNISSFYLHFGMPGQWALMTEYTTSKKQNSRTTGNLLLELNYEIMEPLIAYARFETGKTNEVYMDNEYKLNQYVIGGKAYILPYIALIPEYRIVDRPQVDGYHSQWAVQLHIFY